MHQSTKTNTQTKITIAAVVVALFAIAYAIGEHRTASMAVYAAKNNCTWSYNGTMYGNNNDYTCK